MPSSQLSLLSQQIEAQPTDHFGKFYMYVSLLNTVTEQKKSFAEGLPKYSKGFAIWRTGKMDFGSIPDDFQTQVDAYVAQFINLQPKISHSLYNIAMAYIRKGTISDLVYIIDKMLDHLKAIHGTQTHNQEIYEYIGFADKKESIAQFIEQISAFNQQLLSVVDNGGNAILAAVVVVAGLILILASVFSLIPSLIGLGLIIGGAAAGYYFAAQAVQQASSLEDTMKGAMSKASELPQDQSLFGNKNHHAFFSSIVIPLPYAAITAAEQIAVDDSDRKVLSDERSGLDRVVNLINLL
jgi:hypothetical protein